MMNLTTNSENLDLKIKEILQCIEGYKEDLDKMIETDEIDNNEYKEILEEVSEHAASLIVQMRIKHDYGQEED
jgi:hypothetical protein